MSNFDANRVCDGTNEGMNLTSVKTSVQLGGSGTIHLATFVRGVGAHIGLLRMLLCYFLRTVTIIMVHVYFVLPPHSHSGIYDLNRQ